MVTEVPVHRQASSYHKLFITTSSLNCHHLDFHYPLHHHHRHLHWIFIIMIILASPPLPPRDRALELCPARGTIHPHIWGEVIHQIISEAEEVFHMCMYDPPPYTLGRLVGRPSASECRNSPEAALTCSSSTWSPEQWSEQSKQWSEELSQWP